MHSQLRHCDTPTLLLLTFTLAATLTFTASASSSSSSSSNTRITKVQRGCEYSGVLHPPRSKFKPDPCTTCRCPRRGGMPRCVAQDCARDQNCLQYGPKAESQCCPKCVEMGCRHIDGKVYQQGEVIRNEACVRCYCPLGGGEPVCDVTSCPMSECVDPVQVPGVCCPICPNGPNCQIGLLTLPIGQSVVIEGATCTCESFTDSDGQKRMLARCNKDRPDNKP